jgi:hypothetical protein
MMEMAFKDDGIGEGYSIIFFIVGNFITAIILLNLLLMVTLQQYDEFTDKKYNPIEKFNSFLTDFNNGWNKFSTDEDEGFRIKKTLVTQFFSELNWRKLNFPEKGRLEYIKKYVTDLKLYFDSDDCVYYHDVIYKLINKQMGSQIDRNNKENNLIFKKEKELQKKIKKLINDYIIKKNGKNKENQILKTFNPLTAINPYRRSDTPPNTAFGIVDTKAVNFPKNAIIIEIIAASPITLTEATLLIPTTEVFSPYVVLAGPPIAPATSVATPSPIRVRSRPGSLIKFFPIILLSEV